VKIFDSKGWFSKVALTGIIGSLFTIAVFAPATNSNTPGIISRTVNYCFVNIRSTPVVFDTGVECIYLTEPANSIILKIPDSSQNVIPLFCIFSGFHANNPYPGKYINFSDKIPHKSFRQICLLMDIPPPVNC
jgi:hypothetical protein